MPFILAIALTTIASGVSITVWGHYAGFMVLGSIIATIGAGMIYTLKIGSASGEWIGYQIIVGIGYGISFQIPIIVAQGTAEQVDLSSVSSIILFFQTVTGALFISIAQSLFQNKLLEEVAKNVKGVSPGAVIAAGATGIKQAFPQDLHGIKQSYLLGLRDAYILAIALGGVATVVAVATLVWDNRNLKPKKKEEGNQEGEKVV